MKRRIFTIVLSLIVTLSMMPLEIVMAADKVSYCDKDGNVKYCSNYEVIDADHTSFNVDKDLWLVFDGSTVTLPKITLNGRYTCNLIIKDGQDITVNGGISINKGSLVIYGQEKKTGKLNVTAEDDAAGIGGPNVDSIVINGGNIFATSEEGAAIGTSNGYDRISECAKITINEGNVRAISKSGAGIGTGSTDRFYTECGAISINGGTIYAESKDGAAIGTGVSADSESSCGNIHITGGNVTAKATDYGAGIGVGFAGSSNNRCGDITIDGGVVNIETAEGAGIGLGWSYRESFAGNITINGGNVTIQSEDGQAIGKARFCSDWVIGKRTAASGLVIKTGESEDAAKKVSLLSEATESYAHIWKLSNIGGDQGEQSKFAVELLKGKVSGKGVKLSWNAIPNATKYVVYGEKCGKNLKKIKTTKATSYKVTKIAKKNLAMHKSYKFKVVAYDGSKKLATSKMIHFITANTTGKYANAKSISVNKKMLSLETGKTESLKVKTKIYNNKKHIKSTHGAAVRFISDNPEVATVSAKGKVSAIAEGKANIYIQDIGGLWCKTEVEVKAAI